MLRRACVGMCLLAFLSVDCAAIDLKVVQADGQPAEGRVEWMYHTEHQGAGSWESFDAGVAKDAFVDPNAGALDLVVRSTNFATVVTTYSRDSLAELRRAGATITLRPGVQATLKLNAAPGTRIPDDCLPQTWFAQFSNRVRTSWQPENLLNNQPDFNFLNLTPLGNARYSFRVPDSKSFYVGINHPGFLRFFEAGPFDASSIQDGLLEIDLPAPATIDVTYDRQKFDDDFFTDVSCQIFWKIPGQEFSMLAFASEPSLVSQGPLHVTDAAPGDYRVFFVTEPRAGLRSYFSDAWTHPIHPGRFRDHRSFKVLSGETQSVSFRFQPFDRDAWKGDQAAHIKVLTQDGFPAAGQRGIVSYSDGHYGSFKVFDADVPKDGVIRLTGIQGKSHDDFPLGPYQLTLEGKSLGYFRVTEKGPNTFEFRITPGVGDMAPEIELTELGSRMRRSLADYRGKIVLLECWATWCGPCQPAMEELNQLVSKTGAEWGDEVVVIGLSVDADAEHAARHVAKSGWTSLSHFWGGDHQEDDFSPPERAFDIQGIPHAILIGRDGRILWRGHPMFPDDEESMTSRIGRALMVE